MSRIVVLDADVIGHINRGNTRAAIALKALIRSGAAVYVSQQAYNELTSQPGTMIAGVGPDLPRTATANRRLLADLGIRVAPAGKLDTRMSVYGDRSAKALSPSDIMHAAQARDVNAELWSFDKAYRKSPGLARSLGIRLAPESQSAYATTGKVEDYRTARALMGLPKIDISVGGAVFKPKKPPPGSGTTGGPQDGRNRGSTKPTIGAATGEPHDFSPPPTRGAALANAVELGLSGYNFVIQAINDKKQAERMARHWDKIRPTIERRLAEDASLGVLIVVRYGRRKKQGPEHDSPLEHLNQFLSIDVEYGLTESEAWDTYVSRPRISGDVGLDINIQRRFIPPKSPVDVRKLRVPFTSYGVATFARGKASLLKVEWKGVFGFDEIDDAPISIPDGVTARFLLLLAPATITWFNGSWRQESEVPVEWVNAASAVPHSTQYVSVVDLDRGMFNVGSDKAAMVFPADVATTRVFEQTGRTKDNLSQLRWHVNFDRVRWVRPQHIHVLRKFMEDEETVSKEPVRFAPKEPPLYR